MRFIPAGEVAAAMMVAAMMVSAMLMGSAGVARAAGPAVSVTHGRIRVLLASRPAAGYFDLRNDGDVPLSLSAASAPDCKSVMLHRSINDGGADRMVMVKSVAVPPHGSISFAPGGYHLMCMMPSGALLTHSGTETVTLSFGGDGSVSAPFKIEGVQH